MSAPILHRLVRSSASPSTHLARSSTSPLRAYATATSSRSAATTPPSKSYATPRTSYTARTSPASRPAAPAASSAPSASSNPLLDAHAETSGGGVSGSGSVSSSSNSSNSNSSVAPSNAPSASSIDYSTESQQPPSNPSPSSPTSPFEWGSSFYGMASEPFPAHVREVLDRDIDPNDVEVKPDGLLYLPEIKYRRVLNKAFGPGGWGMAPRSETNVGSKIVSREWALICLGRFVSTARGEQEYFDPSGIATASEAAKSNALMRCCKDLGIAYELWDPRFIREFKKKHCVEVFVEHATTGRKRKLWRRKDSPPFEYPNKELK